MYYKKLLPIFFATMLSFYLYQTATAAEFPNDEPPRPTTIFETEAVTSSSALELIYTIQLEDESLPLLDVQVREDVLYVPFRGFVEGIGGEIYWNKSNHGAVATFGDAKVTFFTGSHQYVVQNAHEPLTNVAYVVDERMYIPLQEACEALHMEMTKEDHRIQLAQKTLPPIDDSELKKYLQSYHNTVSVYYENLETGYRYGYNTDRVYFAASVIKAPYSLYVYQLAEQQAIDLNYVHTYKNSDYKGGTGVIKNMKVGSKFTTKQLLTYAIRNSDNIALRLLINKYGIEGYKTFVKSLGGDPSLVGTVSGANMSGKEAAIFDKAIYDYFESDNKYGEIFKEDLMSTSNPLIVADFPIARKYGWATNSFHDMAIVYAEKPYVLIIMSDRDNATSKDYQAFRDISTKIAQFNEAHFGK